VEDLADDVSLQATDDVALAEALGGAPGYVLNRGLMEPHADDDGAIDRGVQLPVSAAVDAMATRGHPGGRWDGADAGEFRKGGLGADPSGIVADDYEDLGRGIDPDAERLHELRRGSENKSLDHRLQLRGLCVESEPASGEGPERVSDAVVRGFKPGWP